MTISGLLIYSYDEWFKQPPNQKKCIQSLICICQAPNVNLTYRTERITKPPYLTKVFTIDAKTRNLSRLQNRRKYSLFLHATSTNSQPLTTAGFMKTIPSLF